MKAISIVCDETVFDILRSVSWKVSNALQAKSGSAWNGLRGDRPKPGFGVAAHDQGTIRRSGAPNPDRDTTRQKICGAELFRISRPEREHRRAKVGGRARKLPPISNLIGDEL
jgi:hypothetical protein